MNRLLDIKTIQPILPEFGIGLLLDEITAHMDRDTEAFIIKLLRKLKPGIGILNITHNLKNAAFSDRIIVLSGGKVSAMGSHADLMEYDNLYSTAW